MHTRLLLITCGAVFLGSLPAMAQPGGAAKNEARESALDITWSFDPTGLLRGRVANRTTSERKLTMTAGQLFSTQQGARMVSLQDVEVGVPAGASADVEVPAVVLSRGDMRVTGRCAPLEAREPRMDPLIAYLRGKRDVPRATSQLVALCLADDVTLAGWEAFLRAQRASQDKVALTPAEIVQAIDALGILRNITPEKSFALGSDPELKLRALRNPWCRAKAMHLYGIALPDLEPAQAPDLGQLLHTKANDNCPICRLRQGPPGGAGDL